MMTDIRQKIHEAIQLVEKGQLMEAQRMMQPVISIDPYLVKGCSEFTGLSGAHEEQDNWN